MASSSSLFALRDFAIRLLLDLALELEHPWRQLRVLGLHEEGIEATAMVDRLEGVRRHPQLHRAAERIRHHGDVEQIGQEPPLGLTVRVAHLVSDLGAFAGQFASPRHGEILLRSRVSRKIRSLADTRQSRSPLTATRLRLCCWLETADV